MDNITLIFWVFCSVFVAVITTGAVVIFRMRKRHKEVEKDYLHRMEYYKRGGLGISPDRK